ncbi:MAG: universal stress protein [Kiritimatiellaeota bacterium]|nr:universal stress protein [Kiritimatiellota bacterium]
MFLRRKNKPDKPTGLAPPEEAAEGDLLGKLLLVVDGSKASTAAAQYAVRLARQTGGEIIAVYVVDTATMDYLTQMHIFIREEREEFERDMGQTGRRYLDYVQTLGKNHGVPVRTELRKGSFHQTVLRMAREQEIDAVVLGGWRHTITRKDTTSVERQLILDEVECPVIVVKSD